VETLIFPLYEVEDGKYRITVDVENPRPVEDYLKHQGRFRHLTPDQTKLTRNGCTRNTTNFWTRWKICRPGRI
jgi:pyruvate ferredoxin oxidoreductase beta subunit